MKPAIDPKRFRDLVTVLGELADLHERLAALLTEKLQAVRQADVTAMRNIGEQESLLVGRAAERDGLRRRLLEIIGVGMGLAVERARGISATQFASLLTSGNGDGTARRAADFSPRGDTVVGTSARTEVRGSLDCEFFSRVVNRLRTAVDRVARLNRLTENVTGIILSNLRWILNSVRPKSAAPPVYRGDGTVVAESGPNLLELVG